MEAWVIGIDYLLVLDVGELEGLKDGTIETTLMDRDTKRYVGRKVTLKIEENDDLMGVLLEFLPNGCKNLEDSEGLRVLLNREAYECLLSEKLWGTRYDGLYTVNITVS